MSPSCRTCGCVRRRRRIRRCRAGCGPPARASQVARGIGDLFPRAASPKAGRSRLSTRRRRPVETCVPVRGNENGPVARAVTKEMSVVVAVEFAPISEPSIERFDGAGLPRRGDSRGRRARAGVELVRSVLTNRGGAVLEDLVVVDSGAQLAAESLARTGLPCTSSAVQPSKRRCDGRQATRRSRLRTRRGLTSRGSCSRIRIRN
jgi:hypothetical protein